ncbi:MAG: TonB family protein [Pseudomonadota bacterium]
MSQEKAAEIIELNSARERSAGDGGGAPSTMEAGAGEDEASSVLNGGQTAGAVLAAARRDGGFSLEEISDGTKVKLVHLAAIEAGDLAALPATPYAAGFVKAYAVFLGLDGDALAKRFREDIAVREESRDEPAPAPRARAATPVASYAGDGVRLISLMGICAIIVFAIWIGFQIMGPQSEGRRTAQSGPRVTLGTAPAGAATPTPAIIARTEASEAPPVETQELSAALSPAADTASVTEGLVIDAQAEPVAETSPAKNAPLTLETPSANAAASNTAPEVQAPAPDAARDPIFDAVADDAHAFSEEETPRVVSDTQAAAPGAAPASVDSVLIASDAEDLDEPAEPVAARPQRRSPERRRPSRPAPREVVVAARVTRTSPPRYPNRCERNAAAVENVTVVFDVNPTGRAANVRVGETTNGCFNAAAVAAVKRWRFDPRTVDGAPRPEIGKRATVRFDR